MNTFSYIYICINNIYILNNLKVNIGLECVASHLKSLKKKFLRVSSQATITHLKKFIAVKVLDGSDKYRDVSICNVYYFSLPNPKILAFTYLCNLLPENWFIFV